MYKVAIHKMILILTYTYPLTNQKPMLKLPQINPIPIRTPQLLYLLMLM